MRGDGGKHEEDGKHDEKRLMGTFDGRNRNGGAGRCERERRMMMGMRCIGDGAGRRIDEDGGDAKCAKEEQDDLLSWTRLDDERC